MIQSIVIGFALSVLCTLAAFLIASGHFLSRGAFMSIIAFLALLQIVFQLIFFFALGKETSPRWNLKMLFLTVLIVIIIVGGSVWIMNDLNYMMTPK